MDEIATNLGKLPKTLEDAYHQIWDEILADSQSIQEITIRALMWVMCAEERFDRELWAEASYYPASVPNDGADTLFYLCRNLVAWNDQLSCVMFAHLSVQEFLENGRLSSVDANSMAVKSCLSWFNPNQLPEFGENAPLPPFAIYSIYRWPYHSERCYDTCIQKETLIILQRFFGTFAHPSKAYATWLGATSSFRHLYRHGTFSHDLDWVNHVESDPPHPLFIFCYFRLGEELTTQLKDRILDRRISNTKGGHLLSVTSTVGNEPAMTLLLEPVARSDLAWARCLFVLEDAISIRNSGRVATLLDCCPSGVRGVGNMLEIGAIFGYGRVVKGMVERYPNLEITETVLAAAAGNSYDGMGIMEVLVSGNSGLEITEAVLAAAAGNGEEMVKNIFARNPDLEITEAVLAVAAGNPHVGEEIMKFLLARNPGLEITEAVLVAAAGDPRSAKEMIEFLLARNPDLKITEAIFTAAAQDGFRSAEIIKFLLARDSNLIMTEAVLLAAARSLEDVTVVLDRNPSLQVTEGVLAAAAGNRGRADRVLESLLTRSPAVVITPVILKAAADNSPSGEKFVWKLLKTGTSIADLEAILAEDAYLCDCCMHIPIFARQEGIGFDTGPAESRSYIESEEELSN